MVYGMPIWAFTFLREREGSVIEKKIEEEGVCDLLHDIKSLSDQEEEGRRKKRKEEI